MNNVSLNMIIGQRPEPYLEYALKSVSWVDEKVIINTGEDNNPNFDVVAKVAPDAKVIKFNDNFTFSNARNLALENSTSDWILWMDADEVHFNVFEQIVRDKASTFICEGYEFAFYHFLLDMFHFQSVDPRVILFRRQGKKWTGNVHEKVEPLGYYKFLDYRYHHYGYTKPQSEVYQNWRLYWSLNPGEEWKLNEYRNPNDIISDRVSVAHPYSGEYPEVIRDYITTQRKIVDNYQFIQ